MDSSRCNTIVNVTNGSFPSYTLHEGAKIDGRSTIQPDSGVQFLKSWYCAADLGKPRRKSKECIREPSKGSQILWYLTRERRTEVVGRRPSTSELCLIALILETLGMSMGE